MSVTNELHVMLHHLVIPKQRSSLLPTTDKGH